MNISRSALRCLPLALALGACQSATDPAPPLTELPRPLTSAERAVVQSSNAFAFDLLREVAAGGSGGNIVLSPLSVSMSLGMAMNGARGDTWAGMRHALRFGELTQPEINASYAGLMDLLLDLDPRTRSTVANSIWYRSGFPFEADFLQTVERDFDAEVTGLDFADAAAPRQINDWVSRATGGRIDTLVDQISPDAVMYLINAVHFRGTWRTEFNRAATHAAEFTRADGSTIPVSMMSSESKFAAAWMPDYEVVDLPYGNGAFSMTVVVPSRGLPVADLAESLGPAEWESMLARLTEGDVTVQLPRFTLEYQKTLNRPLVAMGMGQAFGAGSDFSGMSAAAGRSLFISDVLHKTFIEVDEEGTEAAAATKTEIRVVSMGPSVRADRPFLFAIRERFSGTILFLGIVADPRG